MALRITSDYDTWVAAAYVPAVDADGNTLDGKVDLRPEAEAYIVYGSMMVGMGELNESTAEEWLTRLRAWEIVDGGPMVRHLEKGGVWVGVPVTMDALRPFFGTTCNVFPKETKAQFTKRVGQAVMERAGRQRD